MTVEATSERMMALGTVRCGSLTSSLNMATRPNPEKAKNIRAAPSITPKGPFGANGEKLPRSIRNRPPRTNSTSTPTLNITKISLNRADPFRPQRFNPVTPMQDMAAKALSGKGMNSARYPASPMATAAPEAMLEISHIQPETKPPRGETSSWANS